ncbi:MAG: DNA mismatch repair protein MutS [Candidatus Calescibacterium sp.]|nr:DNA mismatch repair protein MutS [Candidatus Calescibacterium sp.]
MSGAQNEIFKHEKQTPAIRQYLSIKSNYQDCILLFRMGDFYEMFFDDAVVASKILDIVLTTKDGTTPMAGFPHHAAESYISRLVKEGLKVAICEQLEDPSKAKGIVKRGVVRVITPGLITELGFVSPDENNFIAVIKGYSILWADITTGEIKAKIAKDDFEMSEILSKISPKEILSEQNIFPEYRFSKVVFPSVSESERIILEYYREEDKISKTKALPDEIKIMLAVLIRYIKENIKDIEISIDPPEVGEEKNLAIDTRTAQNIELLETYEGRKGSVLWAVDRTKTPMGKRKIKNLLMYPLYDIGKIKQRADAVEEIVEKKLWKDIDLSGISDIERFAVRLRRKIANPREVVSLKDSVRSALLLKHKLLQMKSELLKEIGRSIPDVFEFIDLAQRYIVDNPPIKPEDGAIKDGVSEELDKIRTIKNNSEKILKEFEEKEKRLTNLPLKIGYNQVFGYYIEVSKTHASKVPQHYIRKQTLTQYERFTTEELEKIGNEIENAAEKEKKLNIQIYQEFLEKCQIYVDQILELSRLIGYLDSLLSLGQVADEYNWTKPVITDEKVIYIKNGRHPSLEILLQKESDEKIIPNTLELDENEFMWIITGPNMAGKSVFLKQSAIITLLAHVGSFVPADEARIGITDRIFFRTGASDDIARGRSTFFVEMEELSVILKNMTDRSFVLLDEVGRGTSTFDGICIAWATAEYINRKNTRCLFATHFHELAFLEQNLKGIKNMHFSAEKIGGNLVFVRKIKPGPAGRSWGIDVAKMAGIPDEIIKKAEKIFVALEEGKIGEVIKKITNIPLQLSIFGSSKSQTDPLRKELRKLDLNKITPIEALKMLEDLKKIAENT